jgi:alpha-galactosidase
MPDVRLAHPPMGWNSWDVYGASVTEREVLENAAYLARVLKPHGWEYVIVDIQWYEPGATSSSYRPFVPLVMDEFSRLLPATNRFPSAAGGNGFKPLADKIHEFGLKFGIHAMRGIPRQAVHQNTAILGTDVQARDIAENVVCPWNTDMYPVNPRARGAAEYYDSLFALYASWGVDFVKVDDILSPYASGEIELIRDAIDSCGRPILLSLSCGPMDLANAGHARAHAEMWRMTADLWDSWDDLVAMFAMCDRWSAHVGEGHWPDADMLPIGQLAVRSIEHGRGRRWTRLTRAEQVTLMTLWCIFRSPLMLGCELSSNDDWTQSLLTNDEVLGVLRRSRKARQVFADDQFVVWVADGDEEVAGYVAAFNLGVATAAVTIRLASAMFPERASIRDLWSHEELGVFERQVNVEVPSHGARLLSVTGQRSLATVTAAGRR